ncbi:MAG: phosphodiester glycosidase family protein, partial [Armatimonadota bacterium]
MRDVSKHPTQRYRVLLAHLACLVLLAWGLPTTAFTSPASLLDLRWRLQGEATAVTIRLSAPVRYRTAATRSSVTVDLWTLNGDADRAISIEHGVASQITLRRMTPDVARLGISIREPARFKVFTRDDLLTVMVFPEWLSAVPVPQSVAYRTLTLPTRAGRARVHVVTLDPRAQALTIRPAMGGAVVAATETTSRAASRLEAVAAINGSFYTRAGLPIGLLMIEGRLLSAPHPRRVVFAVDERGRPSIGPTEFNGRLFTDTGVMIPVSAVNRPPRWGGIALYTPEFGPLTFPQALVAIVQEDRVVGLSSGRPVIPQDGYVLAAAGSQQDLLRNLVPGQLLRLDLALSPSGMHHAIQGGPQLVRNGEIFIPYAWEGFRRGFYNIRTARSALGLTPAGKVLFVTVDGRSRHSTGVNLSELAILMRGLGARDAMNLDGGGSATLVVGGRVVSALPRGGERTVSSMIVALRRPTEKAP